MQGSQPRAKPRLSFRLPASSFPIEGVFKGKGILWDREDAQWPSDDAAGGSSSGNGNGKARPFKHILAGLELDADRVKSFRQPDLTLDLLGPEVDPFAGYKRNDFNRQLQRMYLQFMRPDRFRNYIGMQSVMSGWQYPNGRDDVILDTLLNLGYGFNDVENEVNHAKNTLPLMYGPDPLDPGGANDWSDRVGYRIMIPRESETSTISYTREELNTRFEQPFASSGETSSAASKFLEEERRWRTDGVQYSYELEVRINPLLSQFLKKGEPFKLPKQYDDEYGALNPTIYTPGDKWMDDPSLTFTFNTEEKKTVNQAAALETIYSVLAGRIGAGVPVISMGPHKVKDAWRLVSLRVLPDQHLIDALVETQTRIVYLLDENQKQRAEELEKLFLARVESFQDCIDRLSKIGFLHLGLSSVNMFQGTVWKPGQGGEGAREAKGVNFNGAGATYVRDFRPRNVALVRLPETTCSTIMRAILILDMYTRDTDRKIDTFLNTVSQLIVEDITKLITGKRESDQLSHFYELMEFAFKFYYSDAVRYTGANASGSPLAPPPVVSSPPPPPPLPLKPKTTPPKPMKTDLRSEKGLKMPLRPEFEDSGEEENKSKPSDTVSNEKLNTSKNAGLFSELLTKGTSMLRRVSTRAKVEDGSSKKASSLMNAVSRGQSMLSDKKRGDDNDGDDDASTRSDEFVDDNPVTPSKTPSTAPSTTPPTRLVPSKPSATPKTRPTPPKAEEDPKQLELKRRQGEQAKKEAEALINQLRKNLNPSSDSEDSDVEAAIANYETLKNSLSQGTFPVDAYVGQDFNFDVSRLQDSFKAESKGATWSPPRDSVVLAVRLTNRLYELVRRIVYMRDKSFESSGVPEDEIRPAQVRNYCGPGPENGETKSALELVAVLLQTFASTKAGQ